jgi:pSer/pThr/pTyr-binding forkhead associated (FHA) protein
MAAPAQIFATWLIGTDASCDIVLHDRTVSAQHCRLFQYRDSSFALEDLGSTNGTYVDDIRLAARRPKTVRRDQHITVGLTTRMPWPE